MIERACMIDRGTEACVIERACMIDRGTEACVIDMVTAGMCD